MSVWRSSETSVRLNSDAIASTTCAALRWPGGGRTFATLIPTEACRDVSFTQASSRLTRSAMFCAENHRSPVGNPLTDGGIAGGWPSAVSNVWNDVGVILSVVAWTKPTEKSIGLFASAFRAVAEKNASDLNSAFRNGTI